MTWGLSSSSTVTTVLLLFAVLFVGVTLIYAITMKWLNDNNIVTEYRLHCGYTIITNNPEYAQMVEEGHVSQCWMCRRARRLSEPLSSTASSDRMIPVGQVMEAGHTYRLTATCGAKMAGAVLEDVYELRSRHEGHCAACLFTRQQEAKKQSTVERPIVSDQSS